MQGQEYVGCVNYQMQESVGDNGKDHYLGPLGNQVEVDWDITEGFEYCIGCVFYRELSAAKHQGHRTNNFSDGAVGERLQLGHVRSDLSELLG